MGSQQQEKRKMDYLHTLASKKLQMDNRFWSIVPGKSAQDRNDYLPGAPHAANPVKSNKMLVRVKG